MSSRRVLVFPEDEAADATSADDGDEWGSRRRKAGAAPALRPAAGTAQQQLAEPSPLGQSLAAPVPAGLGPDGAIPWLPATGIQIYADEPDQQAPRRRASSGHAGSGSSSSSSSSRARLGAKRSGPEHASRKRAKSSSPVPSSLTRGGRRERLKTVQATTSRLQPPPPLAPSSASSASSVSSAAHSAAPHAAAAAAAAAPSAPLDENEAQRRLLTTAPTHSELRDNTEQEMRQIISELLQENEELRHMLIETRKLLAATSAARDSHASSIYLPSTTASAAGGSAHLPPPSPPARQRQQPTLVRQPTPIRRNPAALEPLEPIGPLVDEGGDGWSAPIAMRELDARPATPLPHTAHSRDPFSWSSAAPPPNLSSSPSSAPSSSSSSAIPPHAAAQTTGRSAAAAQDDKGAPRPASPAVLAQARLLFSHEILTIQNRQLQAQLDRAEEARAQLLTTHAAELEAAHAQYARAMDEIHLKLRQELISMQRKNIELSRELQRRGQEPESTFPAASATTTAPAAPASPPPPPHPADRQAMDMAQ